MEFKRCLIRLQKGVSKGLKGHLLEAKRALIASHFMVFTKSVCEKFGQNSHFQKFVVIRFTLCVESFKKLHTEKKRIKTKR